MNAFPGRSPTARERDYLSALAAGVRRPGISGKAGHLCRRFGWCEFIYLTSGGEEVARSALPPRMDAIAIVRAGYRAIGPHAARPHGSRRVGRDTGDGAPGCKPSP